MSKHPVSPNDLPTLALPAAATYTGLPQRYLRALVQERRIPFYRVAGSRIRFCRADLDAFLLAERVEPWRRP